MPTKRVEGNIRYNNFSFPGDDMVTRLCNDIELHKMDFKKLNELKNKLYQIVTDNIDILKEEMKKKQNKNPNTQMPTDEQYQLYNETLKYWISKIKWSKMSWDNIRHFLQGGSEICKYKEYAILGDSKTNYNMSSNMIWSALFALINPVDFMNVCFLGSGEPCNNIDSCVINYRRVITIMYQRQLWNTWECKSISNYSSFETHWTRA